MEVYQPAPQHQHPQQQYHQNPFVDDVEKASSINSGQQLHPLPSSHSPVNLAYNHGHGYALPIISGAPANYHAAPEAPVTNQHISSSASSDNHKKMGGSNKSIINVQARLAGCIFALIVILFAAVIGLAAGLGMTQEVLRQTRSDLLLAQAKLVAPGTGYVDLLSTSTPTPPHVS